MKWGYGVEEQTLIVSPLRLRRTGSALELTSDDTRVGYTPTTAVIVGGPERGRRSAWCDECRRRSGDLDYRWAELELERRTRRNLKNGLQDEEPGICVSENALVACGHPTVRVNAVTHVNSVTGSRD